MGGCKNFGDTGGIAILWGGFSNLRASGGTMLNGGTNILQGGFTPRRGGGSYALAGSYHSLDVSQYSQLRLKNRRTLQNRRTLLEKGLRLPDTVKSGKEPCSDQILATFTPSEESH